jgi:anti-sigma B factor antagonist
MSDFRFETSQRGDEHVVRLFGEFDITGFDRVDDELRRIQSNGQPLVTLDLRGLTFIDSSGIRAILKADARARALGRRLRLIAGPERVHKVFRITRLDDHLEFVEPED